MKVHQNLTQLPSFRNAVITIGSFDGVHQGHQKIIAQVNDLARSIGGESVLITFHPHPRMVIYPREGSVQLIDTIEEKISLLSHYGIDHLVIVPFTVEFSQLSADEYIEKFLVARFHPKYIVIGFDHRFGLGRQGDINFLRWHGQRLGYEVVEISAQQVEEITVSSTKIRKALDKGDVRAASKLMNHYFTLTGKVVHGKKVGNTLGFPTANLELTDKNKLVPPDGVYAAFVRLRDQRFGGMLYIGTRPTMGESLVRTIEVNIFGWNQAIYGEQIQLELVDFIRGDKKFDDLDALRAQLAKDQEKSESLLLKSADFEAKKKSGDSPSVAVVILNYNGRHFLQKFLPALRQSTYPNLDIVIADNGSTDDSLGFLQDHYPDLEVIDLQHNFGFAEGYNRALRRVRASYYVLLNSDIEVTPGWIEPIIELMERDHLIAAAQPKILSYANRHQFEYAGASGGWLDHLGYPFCRGRILACTENDEGQYDQPAEIFWATGAAFFVRATLFHNIGGFDGSYFAHAEEIDLCWRMKTAGYKVVAYPKSIVYHVGGGTLEYYNPFKTYLNFRNTLYTITKNEPEGKLFWLLPLRLILDGLAGILFLSQGRLRHIWAIIRAHWAFYYHFAAVWRERNRYAALIDKVRISPFPRKAGRYRGAMAWDYYVRGKRFFRQLIQE